MLKFKTLVDAAMDLIKPLGQEWRQAKVAEQGQRAASKLMDEINHQATGGYHSFDFSTWVEAPTEKIPAFLSETYHEAIDMAKVAARNGAKTVGFMLKSSADSLLSFNADGLYLGKFEIAKTLAVSNMHDICNAQLFFDCSNPEAPKLFTPDLNFFERKINFVISTHQITHAQLESKKIAEKLFERQFQKEREERERPKTLSVPSSSAAPK